MVMIIETLVASLQLPNAPTETDLICTVHIINAQRFTMVTTTVERGRRVALLRGLIVETYSNKVSFLKRVSLFFRVTFKRGSTVYRQEHFDLTFLHYITYLNKKCQILSVVEIHN